MTDELLINKLKENLGSVILESANPESRRIFVKIGKDDLLKTVDSLRHSFGFTYLVTITGLDKGDDFELLYHFADEFTCLTVRMIIPKTEPKISTITGIIPGAILYERELQDMFGITVENIPDARPLVMPDDWPEKNYPLRKDWKYEAPPEKIPGGNL